MKINPHNQKHENHSFSSNKENKAHQVFSQLAAQNSKDQTNYLHQYPKHRYFTGKSYHDFERNFQLKNNGKKNLFNYYQTPVELKSEADRNSRYLNELPTNKNNFYQLSNSRSKEYNNNNNNNINSNNHNDNIVSSLINLENTKKFLRKTKTLNFEENLNSDISSAKSDISQKSNKSHNKNSKKNKEKLKLNLIELSPETKIIPLKNFKNTQYIGDIFLGDPEQAIPVIFDTGSGNLWVTSSLCRAESCKNHVCYNHEKSKHFKKLGLGLQVTFGTGVVIGEINEDVLHIGDIKIKKQKFAEILDESGDVFSAGKFSGILGLGFPGMAAYNINPVFDNIISQKNLERNIMSFYYSYNENTDGEVIFGDINRSKFHGELEYYPLVERYYWTIRMDDVKLGDKSLGLCKNGCLAVVDTGTTLISAPTSDLRVLLEHISINSDCSGLENGPVLKFVFGGKEYELHPDEYVSRNYESDAGGNVCRAMLMPLDVPEPQ